MKNFKLLCCLLCVIATTTTEGRTVRSWRARQQVSMDFSRISDECLENLMDSIGDFEYETQNFRRYRDVKTAIQKEKHRRR